MQQRERSVECRWCRRKTWNVTAVCDSCGEIEEYDYRRSEDSAA